MSAVVSTHLSHLSLTAHIISVTGHPLLVHGWCCSACLLEHCFQPTQYATQDAAQDDLTTPCKQVAHIGVNEPVLRHAKLALSLDAFKIVLGTWEYRYCRLYNTDSQHHAQSLNI